MKELKNITTATVDTTAESPEISRWEATQIVLGGTLKTDKTGNKIEFTSRTFGDTTKYTFTLKVQDDDEYAILARENTWVYVDGVTQKQKDALESLWAKGRVNAATQVAVVGHLVKTPSTKNLNDLLNLKQSKILVDKGTGNNKPVMSLDEAKAMALTKPQWQELIAERKAQNAGVSTDAPVAPSAPVAPVVPF